MKSEDGSKATITNNYIGQNGLSGLSLDGGCFEIKGNKIFDNWLWGMSIKSKSSSYILNNDIFENKCGGIRIGSNYSASVLLDGNTIRNHLGPDIHAINTPTDIPYGERVIAEGLMVSDDETFPYSRPAIITSTNIKRDNNKGMQHPKQTVDLMQTCCYCRESTKTLKTCVECKKATYCSKYCQAKHWKRHKHICKLLQESYIIHINMADTKTFTDFTPGIVIYRFFHPTLKGIQEGPPPDKSSSNKFIVKVQTGKEYGWYDPDKELVLYDRSVAVDITLSNPTLYHLANECGVLAASKFTVKKIYCWASFMDKGKILCIHTDNLPPLQTW